MVDIVLLDSLVCAIAPGTTLVLVGDVDQLPPVGPGMPLTDLIRSEQFTVSRLSRVYRQGQGSVIIDCAHQVNRGKVPETTPPGTPLQDFYFVAREEPEDILATIETLVASRIPDRFGLDPLKDVQVLSPMRAGAVGVLNLNERLQSRLNGQADGMKVGSALFRMGDRVMQIRNDYERNVFNGDVGFIQKLIPSEGKLIVSIDERPVVYEKEDLEHLVLAYAVSVHKSQGSEYPGVVLPVTTQHFKMLQRNLIYTALTRGKRLVVVVGTERAMALAVRNNDVSARHALLAERLRSRQPLDGHLGWT